MKVTLSLLAAVLALSSVPAFAEGESTRTQCEGIGSKLATLSQEQIDAQKKADAEKAATKSE